MTAMTPLSTPQAAAQWLHSHGTRLQTDSRKVQAGDVFLAWPGAAHDARRHVLQALQQGAAAALVDAQGVSTLDFAQPQNAQWWPRIATYPHLKTATAQIAAQFYGHPSHALDVLAVTGTNGKTSTAWWLAQALSRLGTPARTAGGELAASPAGAGMVGTLGVGCFVNAQPDITSTGLTTPDPVLLQGALRHMVQTGVRHCVMEASSIGIQEHRLDATSIRVAVFTNFTQDHLDYHGSMAAYWQAKRALFDWPGLQAAVINVDDAHGAQLADELAQASTGAGVQPALNIWAVSCQSPGVDCTPRAYPCLHASNIHYGAQGLDFVCTETSAAGEAVASIPVATAMIGTYNVSNLLGVLAALRALGVELAQAVALCQHLLPVPGRMECIHQPGLPLAVVDYAHTPDALDKALAALRPLAQQRGGKLWAVFGCGGDRDPAKRPLMAQAVEQAADYVVVTSDNPRSEDPQAIIAHITAGLRQPHAAHIQPERAAAITDTLRRAAASDVVLIAGKGHEDYQEIHGVRYPFNDKGYALDALHSLGDKRDRGGHDAAMHLSLNQIAQWVDGAQVVGQMDAAAPIARVHTDSRSLQAGDLFVALKGEHFDAHRFLAQARADGASAALCEAGHLHALHWCGVEVPDTRVALGQLAAGWRRQFELPLVAVTGSNGKTTVTQMLASILRAAAGHAALATQGNLNNDIGVPHTLLRLRPAHRLAVVELGMNHPGEIATLAHMAAPTVALVNNAQREHQEFMGTVQAVAHENGSVLQSLPASGVAVFPSDDAFTPLWRDMAAPRAACTFALAQGDGCPDVFATRMHWQGAHWQVNAHTPQGDLAFALHVAGRHNVKNALAAVACAQAAGVELAHIAQGLSAFVPVKGRSRALALRWRGAEGVRPVVLVDDTYNANPDSVLAAIDVLAELPAPRLLVLGDMGEVGTDGAAFHAEVGRYAQQRGIERLLTLGALAQHSAAQHTCAQHCGHTPHDMPALLAALPAAMADTCSVLVKGSRFMQMERVIDMLDTHQEQEPA